MSDNACKLIVVGDVHPDRARPETLFEAVMECFKTVDLRICQLECTMSDKGTLRTDVRNPAHRVSPNNIKALTNASFDIVTFAGNNSLDYGIEAFLDTIERLKAEGIAVVGAGRNIKEAQASIFLECNEVKLAFVNFCSILRDGYAATQDRPGISPLRVSTFYEPLENIFEQPGTPAKTITIPDYDDLNTVKNIIRASKESADIVIAGFHWGVHFTYDLAMYQPEVAYAAVDAGADLVIGSHPHCLQAIDIYKGKYIFYSLGNFAFEQQVDTAKRGVGEYLSFYGISPDSSGANPHPAHCRSACILTCDITKAGVKTISITPTYFTESHRPEIQLPGSEKYEEIFAVLKKLCDGIGTNVRTRSDGSLTVDNAKKFALDTRDLLRRRKISYPHLRELACTV
jgi:poly-gamma-glutamate synthesis protein (capsule biosynthesis protein)